MASTLKQRLRRFNGTDYDTVHLETNANAVLVDSTAFDNPLNTNQLALGMNTVYFKAYPDLKWCVDHLDGDYAYLGLYNATEKTTFGSSINYNGSTIATKCTTFLNNKIPNVAQYLESVTVNGVTNKVFIPSYKMFNGYTAPGGGDDNDPAFSWPVASLSNRKACVSNWSTIGSVFWLSSPFNPNLVCSAKSNGSFDSFAPSGSYGFRPEVKVRYKSSEQDTLDHVLENIISEIPPSPMPYPPYAETQVCDTLIASYTITDTQSAASPRVPKAVQDYRYIQWHAYGNVRAYANINKSYYFGPSLSTSGGDSSPISKAYRLHMSASQSAGYITRNFDVWSFVGMKISDYVSFPDLNMSWSSLYVHRDTTFMYQNNNTTMFTIEYTNGVPADTTSALPSGFPVIAGGGYTGTFSFNMDLYASN